MAWQIFGTLPAGNQPLSVFDTLTAQIAKCVLVPCTAAGTNTITLTGTTNAPLNIAAYSDLVTFQFVAAATSTGTVTIAYGALAPLNVYFSDGVTQVAAGGIVSNQPYQAIFSQPLNGGLGGFYLGQPVQKASGSEPTRQVFTSGTGATYTTPAGAKQLYIRMAGPGGGGGGTGSAGGAASGPTIFNAINANAGAAGAQGNSGGSIGGAGGTGGTGSASVRIPGQSGANGLGVTLPAATAANVPVTQGGAGVLGNNGGNGGGVSVAGPSNGGAGAGGGAGEYVEIIINTPVATYTYTVGTGGAAGTGGSPTAGSNGIIIVEERY